MAFTTRCYRVIKAKMGYDTCVPTMHLYDKCWCLQNVPNKRGGFTRKIRIRVTGKRVFNLFYNANCDKICIENPRPLKIIGLPKESQRIQPYEYGHPYSKLTYLWLKGLPNLIPTKIIESYTPFVNAGSFTSNGNRRAKTGITYSALDRSKTFSGIAEAMAEQWG